MRRVRLIRSVVLVEEWEWPRTGGWAKAGRGAEAMQDVEGAAVCTRLGRRYVLLNSSQDWGGCSAEPRL